MAIFSADFWAAHLTLTESETKEVETAADLGVAVSAIVAGAAGIPAALVSSASTLLGAWLAVERVLVGAVDQGAGVTLNMPWLAIYGWEWWAIYPTPVSMHIQANWLWCSRCSGLFFGGTVTSVGVCPTGGAHGPNFSSNYKLVMDVPTYQGQYQWRWCQNCAGLFFGGGGQSGGVCPHGGQHIVGHSSDYTLVMDVPSASGQHAWRWCQNCQGLFFAGAAQSAGACPAGGQHVVGHSSDYALMS